MMVSNGLFVCSSTVKSHLTIQGGNVSNVPSMPFGWLFLISLPSAAGERIEYSLDPTSSMRVNDNVVPGGWSGWSVGKVRMSRG